VPGVGIVRFSERDVVRHELVQKIILAYERHARREPGAAEPGGGG
jgi:phosphate starvation-inducible PhoH-like protein